MLHNSHFDHVTIPQLKRLCKTLGIQTAGSKSVLIKRVQELEQVDSWQANVFRDWWIQTLWEGNKHVYLFQLTREAAKNLRDHTAVKEHLECFGLELGRSEVDRAHLPEQGAVALVEIVADGSIVSRVRLGYVEHKVTVVTDRVELRLVPTPTNYPVLVELDVENRQVAISINPTENLFEMDAADRVKSRQTASKYLHRICNIFGLDQYDDFIGVGSKFGRILYEIAREATDVIPSELINQIEAIKEDTHTYAELMCEQLGLVQADAGNVALKLQRLFLGYLAAEHMNRLVDQGSGKPVLMVKLGYREMSAAKTEIKTSQDSHIYESQTFYDTYDTVDSLKSLEHAHFYWVSPNLEHKRISTIFEVYSSFVVIVFPQDVSEEEIQYVLSGIRRVEDKVFNPPGDGGKA